MGMYTKFIIECELKEDTPSNVIRYVSGMVNCEDIYNYVENPLFTYERNPLWDYSFIRNYQKSFENLTLKCHGNIKNYWGDIGRFVEFIKPHVKEGFLGNGAFAKSLYEENEPDEWEYFFV